MDPRTKLSHPRPDPAADTAEAADPARRTALRGTGGALLGRWLAVLGAGLAACARPPDGPAAPGSLPGSAPGPLLGFTPVPPSRDDEVQVPPGYRATPIAAWGEPVGLPGALPPWRGDAGETAREQAAQFGMHHDGLQFIPLDAHGARGLLVINHEYTDDGLLHPGGMQPWTAEKVRKSQAAHGVSIAEVAREGDGGWRLVRPSPLARRITAATPCRLTGPAAGHALLRTAFDPSGRWVAGTLNNCGSSRTPWGTVLVAEENIPFYFDGGPAPDADQRRWGLQPEGFFRWAVHDERFDARRHPNEFHRHGWIVEIDPLDPDAPPAKRTALGRGLHEGAWVATTADGRPVVYLSEDGRFEYLWKFVGRTRIATPAPGQRAAEANRALLDEGTLYVARFDADGRGRWLSLRAGEPPLTAAAGFPDAASVLVRSSQAADALGATPMDRPEWLAIDAARRLVYCSLTNNAERGAPGRPGIDGPNPRARNTMGQVLRWQEDGDFDATGFRWETLLQAGDPANARAEARGDLRGDAFACPDGLFLDPRGVLWIQTDAHASQMHRGEFAGLGNNQMLACDPRTGEVRRFLTGPRGCEITGAALTPDRRTLFVNVQHPGEPDSDRSDPAAPDAVSSWPEHRRGGRPRSATLVIRRTDGGEIGR
ncbi:PhoX family protein [Piscinibacter sakaiensis]|uniref:Putative phosphatase n=1 Tax=Piscinibacter sakaiensis TaxID=1547922 RepID=A0A0K8P079_PISS1|nr:PhoX family phosphatase [Piscinibacter sakaiensis]GAP36041.1 putative phosphatase [Piscinibacter sakaiensis]